MTSLQLAILKAIEANDGKFSWYQLDRWLFHGAHDAGVSGNLLSALHELEQAKFITALAGDNPAQPRYLMTDAGRKQL